MREDRRGLVIYEYNINGDQKKIGEYFDLDMSDHPELKKLTEENGSDIFFEKTDDFPRKGNYYIGYKPVVVDGKVIAVIGLTYKWVDLRSTLMGVITKALIIIVGGIIIVQIILLVFLHRKAIKSTVKIQDALIDYTGDKDTNQIVKKMYEIKAKNEIGYLADVISDLALEIDHYNKETARFAAEKERAQKELDAGAVNSYQNEYISQYYWADFLYDEDLY